jgi:DNA-binding MarR family transcriptional regulator
MKKYLHCIGQVKRIHGQYGLTRHEIALLDLSAKRYFLGKSITVGELIRQGEIASQGTLHCTLKSLIKKNLLTTQRSEKDARVKRVVLTEAAFDHFKTLDRAISRLS